LRRNVARIRCGGESVGEFRGREHREKDQGLRVGIIRGVDGAGGDVRHLTRTEDTVVVADPLLGTAVDHINNFLAVRVKVKRVAMPRIHIGAYEQKFLGGYEVGSAEPLVVGPGVGFAEGVGDLDEAAFGGGHGVVYFFDTEVTEATQRAQRNSL
jgi:hypothetical protein